MSHLRNRLPVLLPLVTILLFLGWEWWGTPRPIRLVRWVENGVDLSEQFETTLAGDVILEPDYNLSAMDSVTAWGWDGRQRWQFSCAVEAEAYRKGRRLTAPSPDGRYFAELKRDDEAGWRLATWRNGKAAGEITIPAKKLPENQSSKTMAVRNDGTVIIAGWMAPEVRLLAARGNAIVARGSFKPHLHPATAERELRMQADGAAMVVIGRRKGVSKADVEYVAMARHGKSIRASSRYTTISENSLTHIYGLLAEEYDQYGFSESRVYTTDGPVTINKDTEPLNAGDACLLLLPLVKKVRATTRPSIVYYGRPSEPELNRPPYVLCPATGKRWTVPCIGDYRACRVTPDGRFAAVIVRRDYPTVVRTLANRWWWTNFARDLDKHLPSWELRVYERPGRLRAYARARETSPIDPNAEKYSNGFILSPDGHTIIFANGYHWKIYRW